MNPSKYIGRFLFAFHKGCRVILIIYLLLFQLSCKKLVEGTTPTTAISSQNVYSVDATAASVVTGILTEISKNGFLTGGNSITVNTGLAADELQLFPSHSNLALVGVFTNSISPQYPSSIWNSAYKYLLSTNVVIEGVTQSATLTPAVKQQILGEARFLRAFFHFYLMNLYGDIPIVITSDWRINSILTRAPKAKVYEQIIDDLKSADSLLSDQFLMANLLTAYPSNSIERVRPTKWAAKFLLSRVYLYNQEWQNAINLSSEIINKTSLFSLASLDNVFKKNSTEAIWQLQPVSSSYNTEDARAFNLRKSGVGNESIFLSPFLLSSFESGDQRKLKFVDSVIFSSKAYYFAFKYKETTAPISEYLMVFRLAEQFLIRAEAQAQLENISGAQSDLNKIRNRSGLGNSIANDRASLLAAILHERQVELFTEWGHRWFDLKRTANVDNVMNIVTPQKGGTWQSTDQLFPIPILEIQKNPNLTQNSGY